jgi:hypothetical protein
VLDRAHDQVEEPTRPARAHPRVRVEGEWGGGVANLACHLGRLGGQRYSAAARARVSGVDEAVALGGYRGHNGGEAGTCAG